MHIFSQISTLQSANVGKNEFKQLEGRSGTQINTVMYAACTLRIPILLFDQGKLSTNTSYC